jgi:hypothetical protein
MQRERSKDLFLNTELAAEPYTPDPEFVEWLRKAERGTPEPVLCRCGRPIEKCPRRR